jgi:hypothetical protein
MGNAGKYQLFHKMLDLRRLAIFGGYFFRRISYIPADWTFFDSNSILKAILQAKNLYIQEYVRNIFSTF